MEKIKHTRKPSFSRTITTYIKNVKSGKIPSGIHLKNAIARYERDRKNKIFIFKKNKVEQVINYIATLKHFMGRHAGKNFILEPWQVFVVANIYGFYFRKGNKRRFQNVYLEIARKNGKTALVCALVLYHLAADDEAGAECLLTANSLEQAKIDFQMSYGFVHGLDPDNKVYKTRFKDIYIEETNSFIKVLASDSSRLDGYNCSCGVIDEYHSAPDARVRDVIRSSQGMRAEPMLLTITTAGFDKTLPCYDLRTVATEIIQGIKTDETFFSIIYSIDEEDDWADPKVWKKSNPNLGVTVNEDFLAREVLQAKNSPADETGVKTKNLNVWCDSSSTWIPDDYVLASQLPISYEFFENQSEPTFVGVDLASNVDLTAVSYLYVSGDTYYFKTDTYIPMDTLRSDKHFDKELYKEWVYSKYLKTTNGNVTDYSFILKDILMMHSLNEIFSIYYDKWNANQFAITATDEGLNMVPFSQSIANFNNYTKEFERLILSGKIFIDDSPVTRYCLRNVEIKMDWNGNVKPVKSAERKKIDSVISMISALGAYMDYQDDYKGTNIF